MNFKIAIEGEAHHPDLAPTEQALQRFISQVRAAAITSGLTLAVPIEIDIPEKEGMSDGFICLFRGSLGHLAAPDPEPGGPKSQRGRQDG